MPDINAAYQWAIQKCNEANIGYSMDHRNQETIGGITYYDCSSFIWYALIAGGFDCVGANGGNTWPFTTYNMAQCLTALGFVEVPLSGEWKPGDIGISNGSHEHTEMVYRGGTGRGVCMGAHTDSYSLEWQVSIGTQGDPNYETTASGWTSLWRYGGGASGGYGWTLDAFCAMVGNVGHEGQYNPGQIEVSFTIEQGAGIGLFQWTPAGRNYALYGNPLVNQANKRGVSWTDGNFQCEMINNADSADYGSPEEWGWIGVSSPTSFSEFKTSSGNLETLTEAWLRNVERPREDVIPDTLPERIATAQQWRTRLQSLDPAEGARYTWHVVESNAGYGLLTEQQIYENVMIMYNIFCGAGGGGGGAQKPKRRKMPVWMMIRYHY